LVHIRDYEKTDWEAICQIHDRARPDELKGSCDPRAFVPIENDPEVESLRKSRKYVAIERDVVVGFVGIDGDYLAWLYVDPGHYRRGIGRQLLRYATDKIGVGAWTIVLDGNRPARSLYEDEGFSEMRVFQSDNAGYPVTCIRMELIHEEP
jgi:GNAT superfamily N-acetyltransferase